VTAEILDNSIFKDIRQKLDDANLQLCKEAVKLLMAAGL
jgi:hypothetical protein